jgi:hypothetical protein
MRRKQNGIEIKYDIEMRIIIGRYISKTAALTTVVHKPSL